MCYTVFEEEQWEFVIELFLVSSNILCALAFLYRDLLCEHRHRSSVLPPFQNEYIIPWLSSFLSLSQLAPYVLMDTSLSGVYRHWFPFIRPTSYHKLIIALPRTCLSSICMSIRYLKRHPEVYVCVCVSEGSSWCSNDANHPYGGCQNCCWSPSSGECQNKQQFYCC